MSKSKNDIENKDLKQFVGPSWRIWRHKRYIVAILAFLGFMNVYSLRSNLTIAIVDMTQPKSVTLGNGTTILESEFVWDSILQGYVLSSFFYGYILTQILGGFLATKIGGVKVFGFGIAATAFFTLITPWIARVNVYLLIVIRAIEGACEGVTFPATQEIWSHWAPPSEKSRLVSISISGGYFGAVVALPLCSLMATAFGWEVIFYTFGAIGILWYVFWLIVVAENPNKDKRIHPEEKRYIIDAISNVKSGENIKIPWYTFITSSAVWSLAICMAVEGWGFYTLLSYLPQIMKSLLGFDLNQAGYMSALPYLAMSIMVQVGGYLADFLISKKCLNTTQVRKMTIAVGFLSQSAFLLLAGYWVSPVGTPFCLVVAVGLGGLALSGISVNPLDIAPKFASIIYGISCTAASISGILSPILTGYIVTDTTSASQWRTVFYISSGVYLFGVIVNLLFTTGVRQPWGDTIDFIEHSNRTSTTNAYNNNALELEADT